MATLPSKTCLPISPLKNLAGLSGLEPEIPESKAGDLTTCL
ncbi:hypothetical protein PP427_gp182 [Salmonella phage KM16]|nr:hypothetical protein PP427_gp182 [Salmonella phage KM16]